MIQINLLPGAAKRSKRRALPSLPRGGAPKFRAPNMDRSALIMSVVAVLVLGTMGWLFFSTSSRLGRLETDVAAARADSTRLHKLRVLNDSLLAQRDTIAAKLNVIQEIDAGRYMWAHIFDEVARALPPYTWLTHVTAGNSERGLPRFKLTGRTGNTFALAKFMQDLESSPFLRGVTLTSQEQTVENEKTVYSFVLDVAYEEPAPDAIQMQPLFSGEGDLGMDTVQPVAAGAGLED